MKNTFHGVTRKEAVFLMIVTTITGYDEVVWMIRTKTLR
jgi:hypothetical protein